MASKIPYVQRNYETVGGCDKIGAGCKNCYAIPLIGNRFANNPIHKGRYKGLVKDGNWTGKIKLFEDRLEQPLHRRIPTTYFVNSRSDTFHPKVRHEHIWTMFRVMRETPQHTYLIFTKRYGLAYKFYNRRSGISLPNVHLYFSVSTQPELNEAEPILFELPAITRGLSIEPCLGPIDFYGVFDRVWMPDSIIVGCESGPNRRPCKLEWIRSIVGQCKDAGVCCYVKQIDTTELKPHGVLGCKVGTKPEEWPPDLRVREMPNGTV